MPASKTGRPGRSTGTKDDEEGEARGSASGKRDDEASAHADQAQPSRGEPRRSHAGASDAADEDGDYFTERLAATAGYLREHDAREIARDAVKVVRQYPVMSTFVIMAALAGGSLAASTWRRRDVATDSVRGGATTREIRPNVAETVGRIGAAALSFALAKGVDAIDDAFPGFREHFEKA